MVLVELLKTLATWDTLQLPYSDQIMTPKQLCDWAYLNLTNMNVNLVTEKQYKENKNWY
jgi:hypothetical protein